MHKIQNMAWDLIRFCEKINIINKKSMTSPAIVDSKLRVLQIRVVDYKVLI